MEQYLVRLAREAFLEFDRTETGRIKHEELVLVLRTMGQNPTDSQVNDMINEVDVEGSGLIEFNEFVKFVIKLHSNEGDQDEEAREIFRRFDVESTGKIDVDEMRFVLKNLPVKVTDDDVEEMIRAVDEDANGEITIEEFKMMIGMG